MGPGCLVGTTHGDGGVGVRNGDDPGRQGDGIRLNPVISLSVHALMMVENPVRNAVKRVQGGENPDTCTGMGPHHLPFFLVKFAGLVQDGFRDAQFADIMHQCGVFQADGVDLAAKMRRKVPVKQHRQFLHVAAVSVEVWIAGIDDAHQDLGDVDASGLGGVHQMEHQGHDNEDKDAPEEQNESNHEVGSGKKADEQVSAKEEDQQNQPQVHPTGIPGAVGGEHVMGGADEEDITEDVPDHKRCSQKDQCRNHMTHEKTGTSSFDGNCLGDGVENGLGKMEKASCAKHHCAILP